MGKVNFCAKSFFRYEKISDIRVQSFLGVMIKVRTNRASLLSCQVSVRNLHIKCHFSFHCEVD